MTRRAFDVGTDLRGGRTTSRVREAPRTRLAALWVAAFAAVTLALVTHGALEHPPTYDELLHVRAAEGLQREGEPTIADGRYERALLYTRAAAAAGGVVADGLLAARLPAWLGGLLLAALVAAWTARHAGALAGAVAGGLLATHLWTVNLAVFARFYTLHALAVFVVFACLYEATRRDRAWTLRAVWLAASLVPFAVAWHLQVTTAVAAGAVASGLAAGLAADRRLPLQGWVGAHPWLAAAVLASAAMAGLAMLHAAGLLATFADAPAWSASAADRVGFYAVALAREMPLLWPLAPLAALLVCATRPRLGWTLAVATLAALAVHSLAAAKATRYVYYVLPWLCVLLGVAFATAVPWLARQLVHRWPAVVRHAAALATAALLLPLAVSVDGLRSLRLALGVEPYSRVLSYGDESDWTPARGVLQPAVDASALVVTSNSMKALHYLGRYDYELNAGLLPETESREEFGRDPRTGRRVIASAASLERVLGANVRPVLVVAENDRLGVAHGVLPEALALLEDRCRRVAVPAAAGLSAWSCLRAQVPSAPPSGASSG
ncbi:MAG: hypothetical protein ACK52I_27365 [Pseudomonadota bacterium]